jgi:hypothetical protein
VALVLPVGLETDFDINTYKAILESNITITKAGDTKTKRPQSWIREHEDKLVEVAHDFDYALKHKKHKAAELQAQESLWGSDKGTEELHRFQKEANNRIHMADMMHLAAKRRQDKMKYTGPDPLTEQDFLEDEEIDLDDSGEEMNNDKDTDMEDDEEQNGDGGVEQVQDEGAHEDTSNNFMHNVVEHKPAQKESVNLNYEPNEFDGMLAQGI